MSTDCSSVILSFSPSVRFRIRSTVVIRVEYYRASLEVKRGGGGWGGGEGLRSAERVGSCDKQWDKMVGRF